MQTLIKQRLAPLLKNGSVSTLKTLQRGIEKESLRIDKQGKLAQTPHPETLGSSLTHPSITTDFSESLLELITPVFTDIDATLDHLDTTHRYIYSQLDNETLWPASMPCALPADLDIPVARYGCSNVAKMKTTYRIGLGNRYGRTMQTIAGIHYNFSIPSQLWPQLQALASDEDKALSQQAFVSNAYFRLIRNFRRISWLLVYLYGASPAVCKTFLRDREHQLQAFDDHSFYLPYATALRMGDLGYQSNAQNRLNICYNSLDSYISTLKHEITTPHTDYQSIGIKDAKGNYQQLSDALLQIENEFYSTIRPKHVTQSGEIPLGALQNRGVEYIEIRCLDVNPYLPLGIDAEQIRFLDCLLLFCLLDDSPLCDGDDRFRIDANFKRVVNEGRKPGLELDQRQGKISLVEWSEQLLDGIDVIAEQLDELHGGNDYINVSKAQRAKVHDSSLTPSAQILADMKAKQQSFGQFALSLAKAHDHYFRNRPLTTAEQQALIATCTLSQQQQADIEAADDIDFDTYLSHYFSQYQQL